MTAPDEARARARVAAHVFVDALLAGGELEPDGRPVHSLEVMQLALRRLYEIGAVVIEPPEPGSESGAWRVDFSPLVSGALNLMHWLASNLATKAGADFEDVIIDLRQHLYDGAEENP